MRCLAVITTALAFLVASISGDPTQSILKTVAKYAGETKSNSYIVKLKDDISKEDHLAWLRLIHNSSTVTYDDWDSSVFHGYAASLDTDALNALLEHPEVDYVEEDGMIEGSATMTQKDAPWGLGRVDQNPKLTNQHTKALNFTYRYDSSGGSGVDIYIIDTGIYLAHDEFGGRAVWGSTFGGYPSVDDNGHGTHVAGIAGGRRFGVAKKAKFIAVKVLNSQNRGYVSDMIAGVNYVARRVSSTRRPSVVNMSMSTDKGSRSVDNAVAALVVKGVHVVVSAGNKNTNAASVSPARSPAVITVGATNITDARGKYSNYGPVVNIFAPGSTITSAYIGAANRTKILTGTSMATPHMTGMITVWISREGNLPPALMATKLGTLALKNVLTGIPAGTVNLLARNEQ